MIKRFCAALFLAAIFVFNVTAQDAAAGSLDPASSTGAGPSRPPIARMLDDAPSAEPATSAQTDDVYRRPTGKVRFNRYIKSIAGPTAIGRVVLGAGWGTARNSPREWGGSWNGFGKRLASGYGKKLIKETTIYGLDSALNVDSEFYRSKDRSTGARIKNALISPFTARKANGKRTVGVPRIVGTYTSAMVAAETWYPDRYNWKDGAKSGTISLGMNAALNLVREFVWKKN